MNARNKAASKRFGRVLGWMGVAIAILDLASFCIAGVLAVKPEWGLALAGLGAVILGAEKWVRWHKDEIESGKDHQAEAAIIESVIEGIEDAIKEDTKKK